MYTLPGELQNALAGVLRMDGNTILVTDEKMLQEKIIASLAFTAVFAADPALKTQARSVIRQVTALCLRQPSRKDIEGQFSFKMIMFR